VDESPVWPPRHVGPLKKPSASKRKADRLKQRRQVAQQERDNKMQAKKRDGYKCRFPLCGCGRLQLPVESSHWRQHKGMGGDCLGVRSGVEDLITICSHRHREGRIAIDKGTLRVLALTPAGANGPVEWWMDVKAYAGEPGQQWVRIAKEERPGALEVLTLEASLVLQGLARMDV
jgi:hypothetical protein